MRVPFPTFLSARKYAAIAIGLVLTLPSIAGSQGLPSAPNELLVKFKDTVSIQQARLDLQQVGVEPTAYFAALRIHRCRVVTQQDVASAVRVCQAHPDVEFAEPNYIYTASVLPNDERFGELWGLNNDDNTDIDAPDAWGVETGAQRIIVAVIDTGIDTAHPDLRDNLWRNPGETGEGRDNNGLDDDDNGYIDDVYGWNFPAQTNDPIDDNGHGTHVAGTIGATGNNDIGITGVSWETSLMAVKFLNADGSGTAADAIAAILYAAANGARIINASWGGAGFSQGLAEAIDFARKHKVLFVTAAGNLGQDNDRRPTYPANYEIDNILSVAATDRSDRLASFSNHGTETVDLAAPGVDILSTMPNNEYRTLSGTSMATPHVSGVAALLFSEFPRLNYRQARIRIVGGAEPLTTLAGQVRGGGRLNAFGALSTHPRVAFVTRLERSQDSPAAHLFTAAVTDQDSVSAVSLHYAINGSEYQLVSMVHTGPNLYHGMIPLQSAGSSIEYFVRGVDIDGNSGLSQTRHFRVESPE